MKYKINGNGGVKIRFVFKESDNDCRLAKYLKEKGSFKGNIGDLYYHINLDTNNKYLLVGMGEEKDLTIDDIRYIFYLIGKKLNSEKEFEAEVEMRKLNNLCNSKIAEAVVEGLINAEYKFDKFKTDREENKEITINYIIESSKEEKVKKAIENAKILMEGVNLTRELVNEPSNNLYPETLANITKEKLEEVGVKVTIYNEEEIRKIGMSAFLEVARGSYNKPRLIVMEYLNDTENEEKLALVGKGVTYDTGGYSIKPTDGMKTMFCDMGGAGTVIGAIYAVAKSNLKTNVVGIVAACENSISGNAYKPGDIINSMKGKTIEIVNTDAEGRLTLADAIYYITRDEKVSKVIDIATLTGACVVALGEKYTGAITNDKEFLSDLLESSKIAGEHIWELPNDPYYKNQNNSKVADIKNSGGRMGGAISAGLFVGSFLAREIPWIHLDIAGTAYISSNERYLPSMATGIQVKTLYYLLKNKKEVK